MAIPKTYQAYRRTTGDIPRTIELSTESLPSSLGPKDVLIKIHAVSLNYRDVAMLHGRYPVPVEDHGISCSDCSAEIVATGSNVEEMKVGEKVAVIIDLGHITGREPEFLHQTLGGDVSGVLREYAVYDESALVKIPDYLSWEEASTLTCGGVTAWTSLNGLKDLDDGSSVLIQGTGGVSVFALLLCIAANITPIITSSSDAKLQSLSQLSPLVKTFNYKTHPDQATEVKKLTNGAGVDIVINNSGPASIPDDLESLKGKNGWIQLVGFLAGVEAHWNPGLLMGLMIKGAKLQGLRTGPKTDFIAMNKFLAETRVSLKPLIDRTFDFKDAPAAFDYLFSGKHVGKVVIKL